MTKVDEIAEIAADGVADGMHIVSEEALAAEKVVRSLEGARIAYIGLGVAIGSVIGGLIAFKVAYTRAELKYNEIAAQEIADMRDHYNEKLTLREAELAKPAVEELAGIVREAGYAEEEPAGAPIGVSAPASVVARAAETAAEEPVVERPAEEVHNVFTEAEVEDEWDEHAERKGRSPLRPYVIHIDERDDNTAYDSVTYTYYEEDDVLANEREEVVGKDDRDALVGEANLGKFGHGSNDPNVVHIRNDRLDMDMEILRSPNSFAQEVHGFTPDEPQQRRGRASPDDE